MVSWLRRASDRADEARRGVVDAIGSEDDPGDEPPALLASMWERVAEVNRAAGRLPTRAVVTARAVLDVVHQIIDSSADRPLEVTAVISVRGILEDFLPTTVRRYLAVDPAIVEQPRATGRTPTASLLEQLDTLWISATELLEAIETRDADALLTQGNFLRTKFTGSDLDL